MSTCTGAVLGTQEMQGIKCEVSGLANFGCHVFSDDVAAFPICRGTSPTGVHVPRS